jgi:hypothetical protein
LTLSFTPNPIEVAGVKYQILPFSLSFDTLQPAGAFGTLQATVVPLPATANMGIALLVCLAGAGVWRKVKNSQAVA